MLEIRLLGAQDRRERLANGLRAVEGFRRLVAQVAMAAGFGLFPEVTQQGLAPAAQRLGQTQKRVKPRVIGHAHAPAAPSCKTAKAGRQDPVHARRGEHPRAADLLISPVPNDLHDPAQKIDYRIDGGVYGGSNHGKLECRVCHVIGKEVDRDRSFNASA